MIRKLLLSLTFILLGYGFWLSGNFKEIAAGVAIFLLGMIHLQDGFKAFTGGLLEKILKKTTDKLWKSLSFGVVSTAIMQSSTLVSLITISFLSAGLISLAGGIGIIFGANLGTTTGAWLIAAFGLKIDIAAYAMPMLVFGVILLFQKQQALKGIGFVLVGMGMVFLGIHYMKVGFDSFKDSIDLTAFAMHGYRGVLLFTLIGLLATVVMQSSHATLVLIITALAASQVTYENALALAIGANLGTAVTSIIGAFGANVDGKRLVAAHFFFNLITALVAVVFIFQLTKVVDFLSAFLHIAADNYTLKLAVFHSIFNIIGIVIMLPIMSQLVFLLEKILPERKRPVSQPRFLHSAILDLSDTVVDAVRKETLHLYDNAFAIMASSIFYQPAQIRSNIDFGKIKNPSADFASVDIEALYNNDIKNLYSAIIEFISRALPQVKAAQADQLFAMRAAGRDIVEAIKDTKHLHKNLNLYIHSSNHCVQHEYSQLRMELGEMLRELERIKVRNDDMSLILLLDNLTLKMKNHDRALNHRLEAAIRDHKINSQQATSLLNDSNYAYALTKSLVKMAEVLFSSEPTEMQEAEMALRLGEDELDAIVTQKPNPQPNPASQTETAS